MKTKNYFLLTFVLITISCLSAMAGSAPTKLMNYQAVARNSSGNIIANQNIGILISIENGSGGTVLYSESHVIPTNQFGLFTLQIGGGTLVSGNYYTIDWAFGNQWLKVDMDPTGGTSYTSMGESQLLAVPYANTAAVTTSINGTQNYVSKFISANTLGDSRIFDNGSQIGIGTGTPNPNYTTTVSGSNGIGTILNVASNDAQTLLTLSNNGIDVGWLDAYGGDMYMGSNLSGTNIKFFLSASTMMNIDSVGNVGIGTGDNIPDAKLQLAGNAHISVAPTGIAPVNTELYIDNTASSFYLPSIGFHDNATGDLTLYASGTSFAGLQVADGLGGYAQVSASAFNVLSDVTMKKNITHLQANDLSNYMDQIRNIEPITYWYNSENISSNGNRGNNRQYPHVGFTAQSLPLTTTVTLSEKTGVSNSTDKLGYNLSDMIGLSVLGIKALDKKQVDLEALVTKQQEEIDLLKSEIEKLKNK